MSTNTGDALAPARWADAVGAADAGLRRAGAERHGGRFSHCPDRVRPFRHPSIPCGPVWARELPNNWMLGQVSGVAVDERDHVWIVHRPRTLDARQRGEEGMCCVPAPPVIELDPDGNVVRSWGGPGDGFEWPENEHGIHGRPPGQRLDRR